MTGLNRSTIDLDPRRKRILFRSWHRGTREMDLLMGQFAQTAIDSMSEADLDDFEALIELPDRDLFAWLATAEPVPPAHDYPVFRAMKAFHARADKRDR